MTEGISGVAVQCVAQGGAMETPRGTTARTLTMNVAFLQEIKESNRDLWRLREQLREWAPVCKMVQSVSPQA